jgi:predicted GH43/DUF377 family glycosyl hydrolase
MLPSIFKQGVEVTPVPAESLMRSPRNYNASICRFKGRLWMAYRSHRMDKDGRCGIAVCELGPDYRAKGNHWLAFPETRGDEHQEDPRLFVFNGALHVAYVESYFHHQRAEEAGSVRSIDGGHVTVGSVRYPMARKDVVAGDLVMIPGVRVGDYVARGQVIARANYTCRIRYARLHWRRNCWAVEQVFLPRWGRNDGRGMEKNWSFFEHDRRLHCIYAGEPHTVLELDGEDVVRVHTAPAGTAWPWGTVRGGTPPIRLADGRYLTVFHSSTPWATPPHYRRYFAGAYVFEPGPPFRIVAMSQLPILSGSPQDGHAYDPRNVDAWKPFVVFPSGIADAGDGHWLVSYGVNDHFTAIAKHVDFKLGDPGFKAIESRYFWTENGGRPLRITRDIEKEIRVDTIRWTPARGGEGGTFPGVLEVRDPQLALTLQEMADEGVEEISAAKYQELAKRSA